MKVTALVHAYVNHGHNAGAETTLHDLFRAMVSSGDWEVEVILSRPDAGITGPYTVDGVQVTPYSDQRQIIRATLRSQLLISHLENSDRISVVGRRYKVPVVHVIHNNMDVTKQYVAHGVDLAVFNTQWVLDDFESTVLKGPFKGSRSPVGARTVVHPRVDTLRFSKPSDFDSNQESSDRGYITLVNLWDGTKGKDGKGAHTFYEMARRFPDEKFLGVVGGYGHQDIRELPNVTILPHTSNILEDVYLKTRVLLMPSRYESFGRVAVEGAAVGVPTIAAPTPGLREALGQAGLFNLPDDYDGYQRDIEALDNPDFYARKSRQARERAEYWYKKQPEELEDFLMKARQIALQGVYLRGF